VILSVGITLAFLSVPGSVLLVNYMEVGWIRAYHLLVSIYLSLATEGASPAFCCLIPTRPGRVNNPLTRLGLSSIPGMDRTKQWQFCNP
jgi:hypothetical protein